uniref:Uncharacterized protein n=1 Tax=Sphaerodactylus townsendi TaxID=933632 RepID=A0ACB8F7P4_9SAUR
MVENHLKTLCSQKGGPLKHSAQTCNVKQSSACPQLQKCRSGNHRGFNKPADMCLLIKSEGGIKHSPCFPELAVITTTETFPLQGDPTPSPPPPLAFLNISS